ncbi:TIGR03943 family protein [Evansella sp. LMS18]|uniref:TIGR03943 family putative permease subunit n=1 Tax=Evansella sp. LMS18 TaxID=2924033 RepID=UPI0020D1192B|nr:TIGR03943 family protein [Evansella sp. LMS18]UTR10134.1 TIGR03943 family protein [Evansella sp. LMS18]
MYFHTQQAIKAIILLLFCGFIFMLHHSGEIIKFINPQYEIFSQIASVIFLFLFFIQVQRIFISRELAEDHDYCTILGCNHEDGDPGRVSIKNILIYSVVILPLVTGLFLPYKELGAAEAVKRGICYTPNHEHVNHSEEMVTSDETLIEMTESPVLVLENFNFSAYVSNILAYPEMFHGKPIQMEGFIISDGAYSQDYPLLARFLVTHCVADAHVAGLLLSSKDEGPGGADGWVKVDGEINILRNNTNDDILPIILVHGWQRIEEPAQPYIYP